MFFSFILLQKRDQKITELTNIRRSPEMLDLKNPVAYPTFSPFRNAKIPKNEHEKDILSKIRIQCHREGKDES